MKNENRIQKGINFLAPIYRVAATFFFLNKIFQSQIYFLPELKNASSVLVVGGGNGELLVELLKQNPVCHYYYLEMSNKMILHTQKRVEKIFPNKNFSITFHCGSENDLPENTCFDAIITPFVLDFFTENILQKMMQQLDAKLAPKGKWLLSDFNIPTSPKWMKFISKIILGLLYFFFNLFCKLGVHKLPCFENYFSELNYTSIQKKYFLNGLIISQVYVRK